MCGSTRGKKMGSKSMRNRKGQESWHKGGRGNVFERAGKRDERERKRTSLRTTRNALLD